MIPYAPRERFTQPNRISDLILRAGEAQADAHLRSGQIWGNTIGKLGGIASGYVEDRAEQNAMSKRDQAVADLWERSGGNPDPKDLVRIYGKDGIKLANDLAQFNAAKANPSKEALTKFPSVVGIMSKLGPSLQEAFWNREVVPLGQASGILSEPIPWKAGIEKELFEGFMPKEAAPKLEKVEVRQPDGSTSIEFVEPKAGMKFTNAPEPPKPETRSLELQLADALAKGDQAKVATIKSAIKQAADAGRAPEGPPKPKELTPTMEANIVNRLNTQWGAANKTSKELNNQVRLMDAGLQAAERGDLAQGAQAVLVTFQKILDPTSVVRESEFARSASGQALFTRLEGAAEKLIKGGAGVPVSELRKFADLAREAVKAQQADMPAARKRIGAIADRYKIPHELIFEDDGSAIPKAPVSPSVAVTSPQASSKGRLVQVNGIWKRVP